MSRTPTDDAGRLYVLARTTVLATAFVLAAWMISGVVLITFCALLIALAVGGLSAWIGRTIGWPYRLVLILLIVVLALVTAAAALWVTPEMIRETTDLVTDLSAELIRLHHHFHRIPSISTMIAGLNGTELARWHVAGSAILIVGTSLNLAVGLLIIGAVGLYLAIAPDLYVRGLINLAPRPRRARLLEVVEKIGHVLRWWLFGQAIDMLAVGILSSGGLLLIGEPAPLALGTLAGLLTFIPYFGALAASIPAILVGLAVGPATALWVVGVFLVCHGIEGYVLSPLIQGRVAHLPPALNLMSMTFMGTLFGPLGLVLASPLAATMLVLVQELYVADVLGGDTLSS